ncbi:MAG: hypothetical protein ACK45R_03485, partial [Candidatus Kapaibacterium sp.]
NVLIDTSAASTAGQLQLMNPARTFQTNIQAGAQTANITYTLPTTAPTAGQILTSDASGNRSWASASATSWGLTGNTLTDSTTQFIGSANAFPFIVRTSNAERMRVTSSGNVGIGTITPVYKLDVLGQTRITTTNTAGLILQRPADVWSANDYNDLLWQGTTGGGIDRPWGRIRVQVNQASGVGGSTFMSFYTNPDTQNDSEKMRLTAAGQLGIGTTTPGSILQVNGGAAIGYSASTAAPTNGLIVSGATTVGGALTLSSVASAAAADSVLLINSSGVVTRATRAALAGSSAWALTGNTSTDSTSAFIGTTDEAVGRPLVFKTDGTERMRINGQQGLIGIGTASPGAMVQINSSAATTRGLIVQGATGQSVNLQEWKNSVGSIVAGMNASGSLSLRNFASTDGVNTVS